MKFSSSASSLSYKTPLQNVPLQLYFDPVINYYFNFLFLILIKYLLPQLVPLQQNKKEHQFFFLTSSTTDRVKFSENSNN